jgi:hypothetical protein
MTTLEQINATCNGCDAYGETNERGYCADCAGETATETYADLPRGARFVFVHFDGTESKVYSKPRTWRAGDCFCRDTETGLLRGCGTALTVRRVN